MGQFSLAQGNKKAFDCLCSSFLALENPILLNRKPFLFRGNISFRLARKEGLFFKSMKQKR